MSDVRSGLAPGIWRSARMSHPVLGMWRGVVDLFNSQALAYILGRGLPAVRPCSHVVGIAELCPGFPWA